MGLLEYLSGGARPAAASDDNAPTSSSLDSDSDSTMTSSFDSVTQYLEDRDDPTIQQHSPLLNLPREVLQQVLSAYGATATHCVHDDDLLWAALLREQLPPESSHDVPSGSGSPYPAPTYRELYISHHPYWFVPRRKIWVSDDPYMGKVMIARFDPRRGCIEGYRLIAERGAGKTMAWRRNLGVRIDTFRPRVRLWLDDPVLKLPYAQYDEGRSSVGMQRQGWWEGEMKMSVGRPGHNTSASFFLARDVKVDGYSGMEVWPPRTIPGMKRVRAGSSGNGFRGKEHRPQRYEEISQTSFRMRHWVQFAAGRTRFGVRMEEEVSTWSTLDEGLYRPSKEKPYQGIFVGDYAGHGCEFLLVMQTERAPRPPERRGISILGERGLWEGDVEGYLDEESGLAAGTTALTALEETEVLSKEAVKLTGDPNVPRGEHTFISDDIGQKGFVRIATEEPFRGARVVRSRGHVAARGFVHDEFIPSQLFMINHDRLAQYWLPFGHISYYQRVDIDEVVDQAFHGSRAAGFEEDYEMKV
ncbi:uncharacterized protein AB675_793 [Cyphellophora attinorum]|uniref:Uncharacterized protein n=1 Tax=Cyphellophora attinorum TaxID=1664694 RepID=A0A0N1P2T4_9EURO|nr:uncharacterized protein AB675_793 [Phialophora attinorum]KPI45867.1 hypothetical protein AB675_793 [Phialophora attinorum]